MARRSSIVRSIPHQPRGYVPRLPHPSWRRAVAGDSAPAAPTLTAQDFWERLGV